LYPYSAKPKEGFLFLSEPPIKGHPPRGFSYYSESEFASFLACFPFTGHPFCFADYLDLLDIKGHCF
jgi:hypothetical protein